MMEARPSRTSVFLPEPPEEPLDTDCCGSGCTPCVFDIYNAEMVKWRKQCERIEREVVLLNEVEQDIDGCQVLSTSEFRAFTLRSITRLTADSCLYTFTIPDNKKLGLKVGEHLILRGTWDGKTITRQYTPVSSTNCHGFFDVLIKVYPNGKMSRFIKAWNVGDAVEWMGPFGSFSYRPNQYRHIGMLAAGTGIAPMLQVIQEILTNEHDETIIHLVYSCRTYDDILMKDVLNEMKAYWNFSVLYVLTKGEVSNQSQVRYGDHILYGRVDREVVSSKIPSPSDDVFVLICGTKSFDKDMINYLKTLGYTSEMYFKF